MVQDREKLREVGLEPDKPTGHIRAIWALTLILAFALVIAGGIYFILWYSPWNNDASMSLVNKTDETKDWQTYTDKTNNLTFKYPTDWTNKDFGSMGVLFYKKSDEDTYKNSKWETLALLPGGIGYHVETGTLANSVAKFITENSSCTAEDKKVADKDGKFVKCPPLGNSNKTLWYYLVENNGKTFYLLTVDESNKSTLDKMVGTLSFGGATTSPSASPSAGYKMYSESQRGSFSFEYPKDWQILKTSAYDVDVEIMELLYTSGDVLNNSQISVEDLKNTYGSATLREIVNQIANSPDDQFISEVQLGGKTAIKLNSMNSIPPRTVYYALNNGYLLVISGESFEGNNNLNDAQQKNKNAFEHLISSFKFQ